MSAELDYLRALQPDYRPNAERRYHLGDKVLSMLIGPVGVGKSTVADKAIETAAKHTIIWGTAGTLTTRPRRYGGPGADPSNYRTADEGITQSILARRIREGEVVNFSIHPNGTVYATDPASITEEVTFLPTMPSSVRQLRNAGFERTEAIYVTNEVRDWRMKMGRRGIALATSGRAEEAVENLEWAIANADDLHFVRSAYFQGGLEVATSEVVDISLGLPFNYDNKETELKIVKSMLEHAKSAALENNRAS